MAQECTWTWTQVIESGSTKDTISVHFLFRLEGNTPVSWSVFVGPPAQPVQKILDLAPSGVARLDARLRSGAELNGAASLVVIPETGTTVLWASNWQYGFPPIREMLDGSLVELSDNLPIVPIPSTPPDPPPPPVDPRSAEEPLAPVVRPATGHEGDLFPYVYIRSWPEPPKSEVDLVFAQYPYLLSDPLTGAFFAALAALRNGGDTGARGAMQALAIDYVEGQSTQDPSILTPPFVTDPGQLPAPLPSFPEILRLALSAAGRDPSTVIAEIWALTGTSCESAKGLFETTSYQEALVAVWQSYFALVIELGCDPGLRDALARDIVADHLLRWLSDRCAATVTSEQLVSLAQATVVLPAAVFPLPPASSPSLTGPKA